MNLFALTLNLVCLCFSLFLVILYFSKKNMNNIENNFFRFIVVSDLLICFFELLFPLFCYFFPDNLFLIGLSKRFAYLFIMVFFTFLAGYSGMIAIDNNEKVKNFIKDKVKYVFAFLFVVIIIIAVIEFIIPMKYQFFEDGTVDYVYGPAINDFVTVYAVIILLAILPIVVINRKSFNKKKMLPIVIVIILEIIAIIINIINPSLCTVSLSLTLGAYVMFHTIENPDLKLINKLELAKSSAEKANNAKSDFLSSMSHELKTPLNAIVGLSQLIKDTSTDEEIAGDAEEILTASNSLLELVDGIFDINQLDSNNLEIMNGNYNPREIFEALEKTIRLRIGSKPVELKTRYSPDIPFTLFGDKAKVKKIINNILTNAVKYTTEGYIEFSVDCMNFKNNCNLRITVSDTGKGIRSDQKDVLFDRFYRSEEDKDSDIQGAGLGLAITKSLVELLEGEITFNSTEGIGTTFTVTFNQQIVVLKNEEVAEVETEIL